MIAHPLHEKIGKVVSERFGDNVKRDKACGGKHNLPLFRDKKSRETEFCDVDMIIIKNDRVKVIFEIEESNVKPRQVCGKFLASALSQYYDYKKDKFDIDESAFFIQVMKFQESKEKSKKVEQWNNLEEAIRNIMPLKGSKIKEYRIFPLCVTDDFNPMLKKIDEFLKND
ncbi:MAG: hypothetical protein NT129_00320 [Candidatus Aenigmarchaeota archaeon]|nr:hypothetical protein [Candidatus Aenigmarchaeota archaeon]